MGGRDKPGHDGDRTRIIARRLALVATIGMAAGLAGCGTIPAAPQPVAYASGRNPCVEFAEDMFGRRYCRRHYAD